MDFFVSLLYEQFQLRVHLPLRFEPERLCSKHQKQVRDGNDLGLEVEQQRVFELAFVLGKEVAKEVDVAIGSHEETELETLSVVIETGEKEGEDMSARVDDDLPHLVSGGEGAFFEEREVGEVEGVFPVSEQ